MIRRAALFGGAAVDNAVSNGLSFAANRTRMIVEASIVSCWTGPSDGRQRATVLMEPSQEITVIRVPAALPFGTRVRVRARPAGDKMEWFLVPQLTWRRSAR